LDAFQRLIITATMRWLPLIALNQIAAEYPGQRVAVVTHNGTIKSAAKVVVGAPAESIFHIDVSPCSITTVSIWPSDGLRALRTLNEQAHLH